MQALLKEHEDLWPRYGADKMPLIYSVLFHVTLAILSAVALPTMTKDPIIFSQPINIEIVQVAEKTQTNKPLPPQKSKPDAKPKPAKEAAEEEKKPVKMTAEAPPDLTTAKEKEPEKKEKPQEEAVRAEPKLEEIKIRPRQKPKRDTQKPQEQDPFTSLLKNLTPDLEETQAENTADNNDTDEPPQIELSQIAQLAEQLTISELDLFKRNIAPCWNVPAGAKYAEDLVIEVRVLMNQDRTVRRASILDQGRYNRDTHFRAAADSALRALKNPKCQPLQLPEDKFEQWKTITIRFDPTDML